MKKDQMIERLRAAGISPDEKSTVKDLEKLAAETGVPLEDAPDALEAPESEIDKAAEEELEADKPTPVPKGFSEEAILEKTRFGLSRDQAIEVLQSQAAHDAALAKAKKSKGKA